MDEADLEFAGDFGVAGKFKMTGGTNKEFLWASQSVVDRELAGRRNGGIEEGGGDQDGNLDMARRGGAVEVGEDIEYFRMTAMVASHGFAAANAGKLHA